MIQKAKIALAEALECEVNEISDTSGLGTHPKWDSLAHMRLLLILEREYNVSITDESIEKFMTLDGLQKAFVNLES
jgi:acyl carrier protein